MLGSQLSLQLRLHQFATKNLGSSNRQEMKVTLLVKPVTNAQMDIHL